MIKLADAGKGHLWVGSFLILLALFLGILSFFSAANYLGLLVFFFGVWGGVECGRYLESILRKPGAGSAS